MRSLRQHRRNDDAATAPLNTGPIVFGIKPPCDKSVGSTDVVCIDTGQSARTYKPPRNENTTIADTLIDANQNSNSS